MSIPPGTTIGKYTVRTKLAEGGMAEIYLCSALGPEGFAKDVVIKRVRPHLANDSVFVEMFVAEARLASKLSHRNVIQIFDFDRHEDTYYLAMEYVRGASLWELRRQCREKCLAIPPLLATHIAAEVAHGLAYAHRLTDQGKPLGIVHRDVTPHNVLLSFEGAVKLTDFGIARASNHSTAPGILKGKYAYMSPEQARGEPVDARTDIFALGIILWEMLTGGRLFEGDSDLAVLRAVQRSEIAPPARLNPDIPEGLSAVVMRALQRDAAQRFQSSAELARALTELILTHARSFDDTDVGTFLRAVIGEPMDEPLSSPGTSSVSPVAGSAAPLERRPEPTAVMSGHPPGRRAQHERVIQEPPPLHSPDEDGAASTVLLKPSANGRSRKNTASGPPPSAGGTPRPKHHGDTPPPDDEDALSSSLVPRPRAWARVLGAGGLVLLASTLAVGIVWPSCTGADSAQPHGPATSDAHPLISSPDTEARPRELAAEPPRSEGHPSTPPGAAPAEAVKEESPSASPAAPQAAPATAAAETPPPEAPTAAEPAAAKAKPLTGTLVLELFPVVHVSIDGQDYGDGSGTRTLTLPAGNHRVRLRHAHRSKTFPVTVRADRTTRIEFNAFRVQ